MNKSIKLLILLFIMEFLVILNIYNGDLTNLHENIEYGLWYIFALIFILYLKKNSDSRKNSDRKKNILKKSLIIIFLGILSNIWWYLAYPWRRDSDKILISIDENQNINKKTFFNKIKKVNRPRHRTEYYLTHGVLSAYLFSVIIQSIK